MTDAPARVVVPREATEEMLREMFVLPDVVGSTIVRHSVDKLPAAYRAMLSASPNAGKVSAEELEKAAKAIWDLANEDGTDPEWDDLTDLNKEQGRNLARAAISSLGL